jgi:hypothetical protein
MPASWFGAESFSSYPPQGRELAASHLEALRDIPVSLLPVFLVDLKVYDWKFPVEQQEILKRIEFAEANPSSLASFRAITVSADFEKHEKIADPQQFLAEMTAYLWSSLQMDAYRAAANRFVSLFEAAREPQHLMLPRLVMICVGRGAQAPASPLFQKLRSFGQIRTNVRPEGASRVLLDTLRRRSANNPASYTHWYIDGSDPLANASDGEFARIFYPDLAPLNEEVLAKMKACIEAGTGPEVLHAELADLVQRAPSANGSLADPRLQHFAVSLLTEGSGTQIYSTSFVQWATRETMRRAQPATLLVRFAPRQRQRSFNAMVAAAGSAADLDPDGSLIDADMGAYYAYLEMMRMPGSDNAAFLAWFEGHSQAFIAGRGVSAGTVNDSPVEISDLLTQMLNHG